MLNYKLHRTALHRCAAVLFVIVAHLVPASSLFSVTDSTRGAPRVLTVVMDDNYPPYIFRDSAGVLTGILVDEWKLWEKKTGIKVEIFGMNWNEALRRMENGEFDVIDTIFKNPAREKLYDFSPSYARIDVPIIFHNDLSGISGVHDLSGFVVGVKSGDNVIDILAAAGVTNIKKFDSYEEIVKEAAAGYVKVFSIDMPPALYFMNRYRIAENFKMTSPLYSGEFHRAVKKGDFTTLNLVVNGFQKISKKEHSAIETKWYGAPLISSRGIKYIIIISTAFFGVIIFLFLWVYFLRRSVKNKTKELSNANAYIRTVLDLVNDAIFVHDGSGVIIDLNHRFTEMYGYSRDEGKQLSVAELSKQSAEFSQEDAISIIRKAKKRGPQSYEWMARRKDGSLFPVEVAVRYVCIGDADRYIVSVRDVSELKESIQALAESEEKFRTTLSAMEDLVFLFDADQRYVYVHATDRSKLLFEPENFLGKNVCDVTPSPLCDLFLAAFEKNRLGESAEYDYALDVAGDQAWFSVKQSPRILNGKFSGAIAVVREITERKKYESQICTSLGEKEVLLRELYHRTKNNMQVIISLMSLHAAQFGESEVKEMIKELQDRIKSMALVHQMLYNSRNLSSINLKEYIEELVVLLKQSYNISTDRITVDMNLQDVLVSFDTAIPCGLVINELVVNSIKHAFPDNRVGKIFVTLSRDDHGTIVLVIGDNGVGVSDEFDLKAQGKVGMKSVFAIAVNQLRGTLAIDKHDGLSIRMAFAEHPEDFRK